MVSLKGYLRDKLWPSYECDLCVGQEYWQGCYCAYYEAWDSSGLSTPWWAEWGRRLYRKVYGDVYPRFDPDNIL